MDEELVPKKVDPYFGLLAALQQIENIVKLLEDNEYKQYIYGHLNPVYYELQRQITNYKDSVSD